MLPAIVALLVVGQMRGYNGSNLPFLVNSLHPYVSRISVFQCTEAEWQLPAELNATICDLGETQSQWHRLEGCHACAAAAVDLEQYSHVIRVRPDTEWRQPLARHHLVLQPGAINVKLRGARGVRGITDRHFSWHWGTSDCAGDAVTGGGRSCYLADDQMAIMAPAEARIYFRAHSLLGGSVLHWYVQHVDACATPPLWGEHQLTVVLYAHGVRINPLDLDFRLIKYRDTPATTDIPKRCDGESG